METGKKKVSDIMIVMMAVCFSVFFCAAFLIFSSDMADAVREGIEISVARVIPSLFPMMFISQYFIRSGSAELAGGLLEKPVRLLFGLPGVCGAALLTSFIGGYPAGARAAETLAADGRITRAQGERLAGMAFCAGPGFAVSMIGGELYKNKSVGLLILTAQVFSCIIIGIVQRIVFFRDSASTESSKKSVPVVLHASDAFVQSAADTASAMLHMCGMIILFQVIIRVIELTGINLVLGNFTANAGMGEWGKFLLPCTAEVTAGSILSVSAGLPFTAFVVGFGGLSVHFQNYAMCRGIRPNKLIYFLTRVFQGGICSLFVTAGLRLPCFSSVSLPASGNISESVTAGFSCVSVGFGCTLLVMCLMSVICLPPEKEITRI